MSEKPILFNGDMVRAILSGRKTQTRRVVTLSGNHGTGENRYVFKDDKGAAWFIDCPYGQVGDVLWVRETFQGPLVSFEDGEAIQRGDKDWEDFQSPKFCAYKASGDSAEFFDMNEDETVYRWKPSIHMPKWACRIRLEITDIRVERLQDISEEDAKAEGVHGEKEAAEHGLSWYDKPKKAFQSLWQSINGQDSWNENPWVWVVEFKPILEI